MSTATNHHNHHVLFGISFDAVPMSGLIVEFIKSASIFHQRGYEVYLDLGYDIKADKSNFFKEYDPSEGWVPEWIRLKRTCAVEDIQGYDRDFVDYVLQHLIGREAAAADHADWRRVEELTHLVQQRILEVWRELNVSFVMVENGTLPENVIFTHALYRAIDVYGKEKNLGKFVMWRDHDLMWWSEPGKYGEYPYPGTSRLSHSPYIQHVVLHEPAREKLAEWSPGVHVEVLHNTFNFDQVGMNEHNRNFRQDFAIPEDAFLIARCTRIIPQKRIDRDIHLLSKLRDMARQRGMEQEIFLFIAGNIQENPDEYRHLQQLAADLGIADQVIFGNELRSHGNIHQMSHYESKYSISDLLAHSDVNSFLTSYDYEGFGNPIGESVASKTPYITTSYEIYESIYADLGFEAPVLPITKAEDGLADKHFARQVFHLITDKEERQRIAEKNYRIGLKHLSLHHLERKMDQMFSISRTDQDMDAITVINGKVHTRTIEINIADHCNLACESCAHFSPITKKGFFSTEKLQRNLAILTKSMRIEYAELLGGEPLLHPNIMELVDIVLASGITDRVKIVTNGVLLHKMPPSFWENIHEVSVSEYPEHRLEGERLEHCIEMAQSHGVRLEILHHTHFRRIYSEKGTEDRQLVKRIYDSCQIAHTWNCYTLWEDYFFKCPQTVFIQNHLDPDSEIVDGVKVSNDPGFHQELVAYLRSTQPLDFCKNCLGSVGKLFPHREIRKRDLWRKANEYTVEEFVDMDHMAFLEDGNEEETSDCFTRSVYEADEAHQPV